MVGLQVLVLYIWVRILVPEQIYKNRLLIVVYFFYYLFIQDLISKPITVYP